MPDIDPSNISRIKSIKYIVILWVGFCLGLAAAAVLVFTDGNSGYLPYALVFVLSLPFTITYYSLLIDVLKVFGFSYVTVFLLSIIVGDKYLLLLVFLAPYLYLGYISFLFAKR